MPHLRLRLACVLCFAFPALCAAQESLRSEFPAESAQLLNRLRAIDKLNVAAKSPQAWWSAIGQIAASPNPLAALAAATPVLVDHNTMEMWEKLLDEYTQLGQDADDSLVPLPAPALLWTRGTTSSSLARLCQRRLMDLPSVVLLPYRQRIDPEAKKEYETGRDQRASEPLRRLVDERLVQLEHDPLGLPDAVYDSSSDQ